MIDFPLGILDGIRNKETVLFIGSGFSLSAGFPSSRSIAAFLSNALRADKKDVDPQKATRLDEISELFEITYGRGRLVSAVESFLKTSPRDAVSPSHRLLASLIKHGFVKTVITTNYDTLIEDSCSILGANLRVIAHESQLYGASGEDPVLYKIHGDFSHPDRLVLTPADYQRWMNQQDPESIQAQLRALFARGSLLFLGYSVSDFNICAQLLGRALARQGAPQPKRFAAIYAAKTKGSDRFNEQQDSSIADFTARLLQYGVEGFACRDVEEFLRSLLQRLRIKLRVKHLVFSYASWYPDQQSRYGGIETFINYLKDNAKDTKHETYETIYGAMLRFDPAFTFTSPAYPASVFFFRAAAKAALESSLHRGSANDGERPDVVHVHFLDFASLAEDAEIPTLCTSHSLLSLDLAYTKGIFDGNYLPGAVEEVRKAYKEERLAASAAPFVTVLSRDHELEVRRLGARSVQRLEAPFNANLFRPENPDSARSRGWPPLEEKFTITYVGRPDRRKGVEILIKACELLAAKGVEFQLLMVGYGFFKSSDLLNFGTGWFSFDISSLKRRGIGIEIRQAKGNEETGLFYAQSDVVVVPSLYEPMGYVVLEAMACERPVVASRTGGLLEAIDDGVNGLLFEVGDAEDLAEKLALLSSDPDLRVRLGQQGRKTVENRRPVAEIVQEWEELYQQAAFAFGASLFPTPDLLDRIRECCEEKIAKFFYKSGFDVYNAAMMSCEIAQQLTEEAGGQLELPQGVPVDRALQRAIATEFQKALRRKGIEATFSIAALSDVMNDLALALLNRAGNQPNLRLDAAETKRRLSTAWFERAVRNE